MGDPNQVDAKTCICEIPASVPSQGHCLIPRPSQHHVSLPKDTSGDIASYSLGLVMA